LNLRSRKPSRKRCLGNSHSVGCLLLGHADALDRRAYLVRTKESQMGAQVCIDLIVDCLGEDALAARIANRQLQFVNCEFVQPTIMSNLGIKPRR
jgi:hypothetical protein